MRSGAWSCSRARSAAIWEGSVIVMSSLLGQSDRAELSGLATVIQGVAGRGSSDRVLVDLELLSERLMPLHSAIEFTPGAVERNETVTPMGASEPLKKKSVAAPDP